MNHAQAKAITVQVAPSLLVDDQNPQLPDMFVVRKEENGHPFSIHLSSVDPSHFQDIPARDAVPAQDAVPASDDHPGSPAIPAQPAVQARTAAGQIAEAEQKQLTDSLAAAVKMLGA